MTEIIHEDQQVKPVKIDKFAPHLLAVILHLVQEMADFCATNKLSLAPISAFSDQSNDWVESLLVIYESLLMSDSYKITKQMKLKSVGNLDLEYSWKGVPHGYPCFSQVIKPFIRFLDNWRQKHNPPEQVKQLKIVKEVAIIEQRVI